MVSYYCVLEEWALGDSKNDSGELQGDNLRGNLLYVIHPQEPQYISVFPAMDTIRNAFSMSPVSATLLVLKLGMMSSMFCVSVGPVCR